METQELWTCRWRGALDPSAFKFAAQKAWRLCQFCSLLFFVPRCFHCASVVLLLVLSCPFLSINFQAKGPLPASCLGARFENAAGAISITTDDTCSLTSKLGAQSYSICYSYGSYDLLISIDIY